MYVGLAVEGDIEQTSGGYRYDRRLVEHLADRGDDVDVVSVPRRTDSGSAAEPKTKTKMKMKTSDSNGPTNETTHAQLNRPYDVLLQDALCHPTLLKHNPRLERPRTIVSLVHLLGTDDPATDDHAVRERERRYLETVDGVVCPSADTRERVTSLVSVPVGELPTAVAPPAGRHEGAALSAAAVGERARVSPFRIAFVGNVVPRKNLETLLEALADAGPSLGDWRLTVVGSLEVDSDYAETVREHAARRGVDDCTSFEGRVATDRLESILERAHVLVLPSRYESFGMVALEAMEYGVVPIASGVGGADEFVADGRNGAVVDPTDSDAVAARLERLASDRDRLARLGRRALATAAAHPTWDETMATVRAFCRQQRFRAASASEADRTSANAGSGAGASERVDGGGGGGGDSVVGGDSR
ncbi:glycosyltransferase family 4 protein [Natronolimnohabitans innermongolicus]|uniref:Group 1 glycosyl transferase n=1 Tax=Natronolimnohabitans innermongolicus JCM 12255 TaxID=1227499 RepID=L9XIJ8_9EURY|nr:glycosyltransferase family 4 protein [Natronolimnohabitans innermongolicus]ELY61559.1 group 1 glycosyl transferase [Natronolimnohabitans innermongolicus JCM 12255]